MRRRADEYQSHAEEEVARIEAEVRRLDRMENAVNSTAIAAVVADIE